MSDSSTAKNGNLEITTTDHSEPGLLVKDHKRKLPDSEESDYEGSTGNK